MDQINVDSMTPEEYQIYRAEIAIKEIALMPKGSPEQFKIQCERMKAEHLTPKVKER
jgi:hypothetical protein